MRVRKEKKKKNALDLKSIAIYDNNNVTSCTLPFQGVCRGGYKNDPTTEVELQPLESS